MDLNERFNVVKKVAGKNGLDHFIKDLEASFANAEVVIPLVGKFNSGKSSLVNCLIGKSLLATDIVPTTATINELRFSAEKERWDALRSDGMVVTPSDGIDTGNVRAMRFFLESDILPQKLVLVDTPGTSSNNNMHDKVLRDYIPQADAVLFTVTSTDGSIGAENLAFLNDIRAMEKDVFLILTKIDHIAAPGEIEKIYQSVIKEFPHAKKAAITSSKQSEIGDFIGILKKITDDREKLLDEKNGRVLSSTVKSMICILREMHDSLKLSNQDLVNKIHAIKEQTSQIRDEIQLELRNVDEKISTLNKKAGEIFESKLMANFDYLVQTAIKDLSSFPKVFEKISKDASIAVYQETYKDEFIMIFREFQSDVERRIKSIEGPNNVVAVIMTEAVFCTILAIVIPFGGASIFVVGISRLVFEALMNNPTYGPIFKGLYDLVKNSVQTLVGGIGKGFFERKIKAIIKNSREEYEKALVQVSGDLKCHVTEELERKLLEQENNLLKQLDDIRKKMADKTQEHIEHKEQIQKDIEALMAVTGSNTKQAEFIMVQ